MSAAAVSQHVALWDVGRGMGWVSLYSRRRRLVRQEVDDVGDFSAILTMLVGDEPVWFDGGSGVIRPGLVPRAVPIDGDARR